MPERASKSGGSRLDEQDLERLRQRIAALQEANGGAAPHEELMAIAGEASETRLVTVDFRASERLGAPMVVIRTADAPAGRLEGLSPRERAVAAFIAEGLANKQIAARLGLSLLTVKDHVHHILVKTSLPNRAAVAAAWAPDTSDSRLE